MSDILCSIIIPYYNVPTELVNKCLYSIINQNWEDATYEIIFINDGSELPVHQSTLKTLQSSNNHIVIEQTNQGPGAARNQGIMHATGTYLFFIDPDDYWIENKIGDILQYVKLNKYDIIQFSTINFNTLKTKTAFEIEAGHKYMAYNTILKGAWTYCYRTKFLKDNNIQMPSIRNSEDVIFLHYAFFHAKRCFFTNVDLYYYYRERNDSLTKQRNNIDWNKRLHDSLIGIKHLIQFNASQLQDLTPIKKLALDKGFYTVVIDHIYHIFNCSLNKNEKKGQLKLLHDINALPLPKIKHNTIKYNLFRLCQKSYTAMSLLIKCINTGYNILGRKY